MEGDEVYSKALFAGRATRIGSSAVLQHRPRSVLRVHDDRRARRHRHVYGGNQRSRSGSRRLHDKDGGAHGLLYSDGDFAPIDVPDSVSTIVFGINNQGRLVGSHVSDGQHGFDYKESRKRVFKSIDVPFTTGVILTRPNDVNNHGLIVGEYLDNPLSNEQHGFLADHGEFTSIDVPDALITSASGINDGGKIVGFFEDDRGVHGFLRENESFTTLDVSYDGGFSTVALGINNADQIVGIYQTSTGTLGFVYEDGKYTRFDVPVRSIPSPQASIVMAILQDSIRTQSVRTASLHKR